MLRRTWFRVAVLLSCLLWPGNRLMAKDNSATKTSAAAADKTTAVSTRKKPAAKKPTSSAAAASVKKTAATTSKKTLSASAKASLAKHVPIKPPTARSIKLTSAFLASAQLRPMAQQLASTRSAAAYAGVLSYGQSHPGEGAAAAYLALGHAYTLDHRYAEAAADYGQAKRAGEALDDYADYLGAQAAIQAGRPGDAYTLLDSTSHGPLSGQHLCGDRAGAAGEIPLPR